jgi:hypothetical protein
MRPDLLDIEKGLVARGRFVANVTMPQMESLNLAKTEDVARQFLSLKINYKL